ncbi:ATP-dependent zinc metalloprotease FtsH [Candidatus Fermentibacterales bacterium]|nr:ATP-dependent zinc metalloprotease FtsH [Candidatus Fermentibacterales bacterium]
MRTLSLWILLGLLTVTIFSIFGGDRGSVEITYSELLAFVGNGQVQKVAIETGGAISGDFVVPQTVEGASYERFSSFIPLESTAVIDSLSAHGVAIEGRPESLDFLQILFSVGPILLLVAFWIFIMRNAGGGNRAFSFGKSRARLFTSDRPKVTFDDVAGADEAKEELEEVIEFLKEPKKFSRLGGKVPKGVLLLGPPGTGKTLLARAVAGEAEVPFFSMSGSDFVEMFVGVGASRVRDLFSQGKAKAPCIIFIDEIDAVGRHRGSGLGGGHDEREQTLNALLVEMDGFEPNEGVIVMAATNRPDVLDPALLRPGRFDRRIMVNMPDVRGREAILKIHTRRMPLSDDVDLGRIARSTPGFNGADLENLANEAALRAARRRSNVIEPEDFDAATDRIVMGIERRSLVISDEEKKLTAVHESGHALVAMFTPGSDPVHKVTIVPRGRSLGATSFLPMDDRHNYSLEYCMGVLARLMGGRASESFYLNTLSTGAGDDLEKATELARRMVCEWGMSSALGSVTLGESGEPIFLGRDMGRIRNYSESTAEIIDSEIRRLVDQAYESALGILKSRVNILEAMMEQLLVNETLTSEQIHELVRKLEQPEADEGAAEGQAEGPD